MEMVLEFLTRCAVSTSTLIGIMSCIGLIAFETSVS